MNEPSYTNETGEKQQVFSLSGHKNMKLKKLLEKLTPEIYFSMPCNRRFLNMTARKKIIFDCTYCLFIIPAWNKKVKLFMPALTDGTNKKNCV